MYSVNEGDGEVRISVRRFGEGVELGRPITVRVSSSEGNATGEQVIRFVGYSTFKTNG